MKLNNPLVSVIIPVFNAAPYLHETINSVLKQSWTNLEIILIDDGSQDNSLSIAHSLQDSRMIIIQQKNKGASSARNEGIKIARGEFIQFLDADDILSSNKIVKQIEILLSNEPDCIASCAWGRFIGVPQNVNFKPDGLWQDLSPIDFLVYKYNFHTMMQPGVWLVPKRVIDKSGFWDESLSLNDDGEYFSRVVLQSSKILFCPGAEVYYRSFNPKSLASQWSEKHIQSLIKSIHLCADQLLLRSNEQSAKQAVSNLYQELIYQLYPNYLGEINQLKSKIGRLGVKPTRPHPGSKLRQTLSKCIGWKTTKKIHLFYRSMKELITNG